mgnify:CR=1 FL=1
MTLEIKNGDCLKYMAELPDKSVDLFICDLPYGETNCKWDSVIDLEEFWKQFKRLKKSKKTLCIHFCSTKFGYSLIKSNEKMFKMDMVWKKRNKTGGLQSRYRPMRNHEMVYFFYEQAPKYNRDRYHKRIVAKQKLVDKEGAHQGKACVEGTINLGTKAHFNPIQPASVLSDMDKTTDAFKEGECHAEPGSKYKKEHKTHSNFVPTQIGSFVTDDELAKPLDQVYGKACGGKGFNGEEYRKKAKKEGLKGYDPRQPGSVVETINEDTYEDGDRTHSNKAWKGNVRKMKDVEGGFKPGPKWNPKLPLSVLEDDAKWIKEAGKNGHGYDKHKPEYGNSFDPKQPASVLEGDAKYTQEHLDNNRKGAGTNDIGAIFNRENNRAYLKINKGFTPTQPASVLDCKDEFGWDKSVVKEKGFCSNFDPPNPASIIERTGHGWDKAELEAIKHNIATVGNNARFDPKLPVSVIEQRLTKLEEVVFKEKDVWGQTKFKDGGDCGRLNKDGSYKLGYNPPNPSSVLDERVNEKGLSAHGWNINHMDAPRVAHFDPKLPGSILENDEFGYNIKDKEQHIKKYGERGKEGFDPKLPVSIVENDESLDLFDFIEDAENAPYSVYASKKCFIGKRNHQTEKPLDILEFFLKYWSDEGDTILDPTMGSGSTGVACAKLGRNFIGYEMDEKIFKVAENRIKNKK